jgi:hypothetical protein
LSVRSKEDQIQFNDNHPVNYNKLRAGMKIHAVGTSAVGLLIRNGRSNTQAVGDAKIFESLTLLHLEDRADSVHGAFISPSNFIAIFFEDFLR